MVPRRFDLEMERRHVFEKPDLDEVVRVRLGFRTVLGCAIEEAPDGPYGLQKGRHAQFVECYRHRLSLAWIGPPSSMRLRPVVEGGASSSSPDFSHNKVHRGDESA